MIYTPRVRNPTERAYAKIKLLLELLHAEKFDRLQRLLPGLIGLLRFQFSAVILDSTCFSSLSGARYSKDGMFLEYIWSVVHVPGGCRQITFVQAEPLDSAYN